MTLALQPYPAYKNSGVEWLGQIPAHWEIRRLKHILCEVNSRSQTGEEQLLSVSQYTGVTPRQSKIGSDEPDTRAASLVGYKSVSKNDLVVNIMLAWNGSMGVSHYEGVVSPAYCVYRFKSHVHSWYYHSLLRLPSYKGRIKTSSTGVVESRMRLYSDDLFCIEALMPPYEEQLAIAHFVDQLDRRVNRLIRIKRRLIELLNEQKQAVIHSAVTQGLDPDAPKKPSGVDWLGDIPAHWKVTKLKRLARMQSGDNITAYEINESGAYPVYGGNGLRGYTEAYTHSGNLVLIGRQGALCGNINYASGSFWASEHAVVATPIRPYNELWFGELLRVMNLNQYSQAAAQPGLAVERIQNLAVLFPPYAEQCQIAENVSVQTADIDVATSRTKREIELIREYRTRLITDVVTGKIDVRRFVPVSKTAAEWENIEEEIEIDYVDVLGEGEATIDA